MQLWRIYSVKDGMMMYPVREVRAEKKPRVGSGFKAMPVRLSSADLKQIDYWLREAEKNFDPRLSYPAAFFDSREGM